MPSRDFTSEDLFSSRMMSMHSSTHSSQMKTVGPAISLRTSCWLLPQKEQYRVFLESLPPTLLIQFSVAPRYLCVAMADAPMRSQVSHRNRPVRRALNWGGSQPPTLPRSLSEAC